MSFLFILQTYDRRSCRPTSGQSSPSAGERCFICNSPTHCPSGVFLASLIVYWILLYPFCGYFMHRRTNPIVAITLKSQWSHRYHLPEIYKLYSPVKGAHETGGLPSFKPIISFPFNFHNPICKDVAASPCRLPDSRCQFFVKPLDKRVWAFFRNAHLPKGIFNICDPHGQCNLEWSQTCRIISRIIGPGRECWLSEVNHLWQANASITGRTGVD